MPYRKVAHHCSFYLMVDPKHREKGVGTSMVKNLIHLAKERFRLEALHIEIYENSPLEPILKKLQFSEIVRQANYMKTNGLLRARMIWEKKLA
jgi:putative acetyltransferase